MEAYSLYELNEYIKRVVALNFDDAIWIQAEISQSSEVRGNYYLELIQKEGEEIIAKSDAVAWYKSILFIQKKLGSNYREFLQAGVEIKCRVEVDFHERFGLKLSIKDLDAEYAIGNAALNRQKILENLNKKDLIDKNSLLVMPPVIQSIAIISSKRAAGLQDFENHLHSNQYRYKFYTELFESSMQGSKVEGEVLSALENICNSTKQFDAIIIIRGGGSQLDLSAFDNEEIGSAIAHLPYPVIVGIGHDFNQSVVDIVSHTSLKTPTAVASFILDRNLEFESEMNQLFVSISGFIQQNINIESRFLIEGSEFLKIFGKNFVKYQLLEVESLRESISIAYLNVIRKENQNLEKIQTSVALLDPKSILKKGYSFTTIGGKALVSIHDASPGDTIQTRLVDGKITSTVN